MNKTILKGLASVYLILIQTIGYLIITHLVIQQFPPLYASAWFLFMSISMFISVFDFGLSSTLSRKLSFSSHQLNHQKFTNQLIYTFTSCTTVTALLLVFVGIPSGITYIHHIYPSSETIIRSGYLYFLLGSFFMFLNNPFFAIHYGFNNIVSERVLRSLPWILGTALLSISCITFHASFEMFGLMWFIQGLLSHLIIRLYTSAKFNFSATRFEFNRHIIGTIRNPSLQWTVMTFGGLLIFQAGNFVIAGRLSPVLLTEYAPLMQVCAAILTLSGSISVITTPLISRLAAKSKWEEIRRLLLWSNQISLFIVLFLAVCLWYLGAGIMHFWLGNAFHYSASVMDVLLVMTTLESNHVLCVSFAMAAGHLNFIAPSLLGALFTIVFSALLAPHLGLMGVALGLLLAQLTTNNWYTVFISLRYLKLPYQYYLKNLIPLLGYLGVLIISAALLQHLDKEFFSTFSTLFRLIFQGGTLFTIACLFIALFARQNIAGFNSALSEKSDAPLTRSITTIKSRPSVSCPS